MTTKSLPDAPSARDVREAMEEAYSDGDAYKMDAPVDQRRHWAMFDRVLAWMLPAMGSAKDDGRTRVLLDLGCGVGRILGHAEMGRWLREGNQYLGLDLSEAALGHARKAAAEHGLTAHTTFGLIPDGIEGVDPQAFRAMHGRIDGVVGVETLEHWRDGRAGLEVLHRMLPHGTPVGLTTPNASGMHSFFAEKLGIKVPLVSWDHVHEFGWEELIDLLEQTGFEVRESRGGGFSFAWGLEDVLGNSLRVLNDHDEDTIRIMQELADAAPHLAFCQVHLCCTVAR